MTQIIITLAQFWPYLIAVLLAVIIIIPGTRGRLYATWIIWTSRQYAGIGSSRDSYRRDQNNYRFCHIYIVPLSVSSIDIFVRRLKAIRKDLVNVSKHHKGASVRNVRKGGPK